MNSPLVSIVIPTYNSESTIEKCLQSIKNQTYKNIEIIVVDEFSKDRTQEIAKQYALIFESGPERSVKRNYGIRKARGNFVLIIDSDMELTPKVVESCLDVMKDEQIKGVVIPEISLGEGFWAKCNAFERYVNCYINQNSYSEAARFFRKDEILSVGGYDPTIVGIEDWDLHNKMKNLGEIAKISVHINHHEGGLSLIKRVKKKYYYSRAFREYIHRYPSLAGKQFFPIKYSYFKYWKLLARHPLLTLGFGLMKFCEALAGGLGLIFNKK